MTARLLRGRVILYAFGSLILLSVVALAILAPVLYPGDPFALVAAPLVPPFTDPAHILGTDTLGRDIAAMLFRGAQVSLLVGLSATAIALGVGLAVGCPAGYFGGWVDDLLMRFTEVIQTVPNVLFALAIISILGPKIQYIVAAIGFVAWPSVARLTRAEFLSLRNREFVQACRAMGMSHRRIMLREILPNALPPVIVLSSVIVAFSILMESALAFLGLNDPNMVSWGWLVGQGRDTIRYAPWMIVIPGSAIALTVLGVSLVGEGLNDTLNPHRKDR